jgi:hypothetical protein
MILILIHRSFSKRLTQKIKKFLNWNPESQKFKYSCNFIKKIEMGNIL